MMETNTFYKRIKPSKVWTGINFRELWQYRDLIQILTLRDIQLRYKQTALGVSWVILQPLLTSAIFAIIFGKLANLPSDEVSYVLFSFVGMLPWNVFSQSLQRSGQSLVRDNQLITRVYFPRTIIPLASSLSVLVDFLVALIVFFILLLIYKLPLTWNSLVIPVMLVLCMLISIGVGLWVSALSVFYRDFVYALPFLIQVWLYASPIAYSTSLIPEQWRLVYGLNPMVGVIQGFRWALLGNIEFPTLSVLISVVTGTVIFFTGALVFRRIESRFADVI